ncbi:MAG: hypothetical protein V1792_05550 [Pseudomonadota bacterium]
MKRYEGCRRVESRRPVSPWRRFASVAAALALGIIAVSGCSALNPGKFMGIQKTSKEEHYWLVKDVYVTPGSSYLSKEVFDHNMNSVVNVLFTPTNEKNHYLAETTWIDPMGQEYRTIRTTHDVQQEGKKSIDGRQKEGTPRVHTMPTKELYEHKPGLWKVRLYLDRELARILEFSVR